MRKNKKFKDVIAIIESLLIALAVCIDTFAIGLSYGLKDIKIPKISILTINIVTLIFLCLSMFFGNIIKKFLTHHTASLISFFILMGLGFLFIIEGYIEYYLEKNKNNMVNKNFQIKLSKFRIIIDVVMDCTKADTNVSGDIDFKEALYLGTALSLDSLGVGFGSGIGDISYLQVLIMAFFLNLLAIVGGLYLGKKMKKQHQTLKTFWISGSILILLGILKLT